MASALIGSSIFFCGLRMGFLFIKLFFAILTVFFLFDALTSFFAVDLIQIQLFSSSVSSWESSQLYSSLDALVVVFCSLPCFYSLFLGLGLSPTVKYSSSSCSTSNSIAFDRFTLIFDLLALLVGVGAAQGLTIFLPFLNASTSFLMAASSLRDSASLALQSEICASLSSTFPSQLLMSFLVVFLSLSISISSYSLLCFSLSALLFSDEMRSSDACTLASWS